MPWVIMAVILSISAVLWRYHSEIKSWYKKRERNKAGQKGQGLGLPMKVKIGMAERLYPSSLPTVPPKWSYSKVRNIEIYCKGTGIKTDPFIIEGLFPIPKRIIIFDENRYFLVKDLKLKKFGLENCEDFIFKNCEFKEFRLKKCFNILIEKTGIFREIRLKDCQDIMFENCLMKDIILYKSNDGTFKKCFCIHLKDWMSRNNYYEDNTIELLESNKKDMTFSKGNNLKDNKIINSLFKMKKLFSLKLKEEIPIILWIIFLICFTLIGIFIIFELKAQGYDVWYAFLVIPGNFIYFIIIAVIGVYLNDFYYKIKLKKG